MNFIEYKNFAYTLGWDDGYKFQHDGERLAYLGAKIQNISNDINSPYLPEALKAQQVEKRNTLRGIYDKQFERSKKFPKPSDAFMTTVIPTVEKYGKWNRGPVEDGLTSI